MQRPIRFLLSAMLVLFAAASAPAGVPPQAAGAKPAATPAGEAKGKKLYAIDCAMCHGDNGNGQTDLAKDMQLTLLDWTDPKSLAAKSDQELIELIRKGKDKMPPEDSSRATDDDLKSLIRYIRDFSKGQPAPAAGPTQ
jgi:cytochrome c5